MEKFKWTYGHQETLCRMIDRYLVNTGLFGDYSKQESYSKAHDVGSPLSSIVRDFALQVIDSYYQQQIKETSKEVMKRLSGE